MRSFFILMQHGDLSELLATALAEQASHVARHWRERAVAATPRAAHAGAAGAHAANGSDGDNGAAAAGGLATEVAAEVVCAVAATLGGRALRAGPTPDARPAAEVMRLGWAAGRAACAAGLSVHHVVRDAELLTAVLLAEVERQLAAPALAGAPAAEAVGAARRLHRAAGRFAQAAVGGFVHALLADMRERYRLLRHDLRNPLGTIQSALSLMDDESVPAETRHAPGIRAMVARNAGSLDRLIGSALDDASAAALLAPAQEVGLRAVALAARREVREVARLTGCEVAVDLPESLAWRADAAGLEFALTAVLLAVLARSGPGVTLRVGALEPAESGALVLRVAVDPPAAAAVVPESDGGPGAVDWDEPGLRLAAALAADHGVALVAGPSADPGNVDRLVAALARAPVLYLRLPGAPAPMPG